MTKDIRRLANDYVNKRNLLFGFLTGVALLMAYSPLRELLRSTTQSEYYSHIILIPVVSIFFFYLNRKEIFSNSKYSYGPGGALFAIGIALYFLGMSQRGEWSPNDYTAINTFSVLIFWTGAFIFCFGIEAFRTAMFPILFLIFMIPIPEVLMYEIIYFLQVGSTEFAHLLFLVTGIPFAREGFVFHLPGMSVEVAHQCSGIRSSLGLLITGILAGYLFLKAGWRRVILALFVFPITVFKNSIRIVTLSALGVYVGERFITQSFLHRSGGFIFYIPALLLLGVVLWWLRRSEQR